jgi:hypothetical protein
MAQERKSPKITENPGDFFALVKGSAPKGVLYIRMIQSREGRLIIITSKRDDSVV